MSVQKLVRRDTPLTAVTKIAIRATIYFDVDVGEWLDGDPFITLDDILVSVAHARKGERGATDKQLFEYALSNLQYDLGDVEFTTEVEREGVLEEVEFEAQHQYVARIEGRPTYWDVEYVEPIEVTS